ncbi:HAD-like domain-containing protein [Dichotomocladium elegans]|nr:HAD-like domain-containing protein [Dichotomocladium elegans]
MHFTAEPSIKVKRMMYSPMSVASSIKAFVTKKKKVNLRRIRLVASDLDGTLMVGEFNAGHLSKRTIKVLRSAEENGTKLVFASGRPTRTMLHAVEQANLNNLWCICCNGAQILDSHTKTIIKKFSIPRQHVEQIISRVKELLGDDVYVAAESDIFYKGEAGFDAKCGHLMQGKCVVVDDPRTDFFQTEQDTVENLLLVHKTWPTRRLYEFLNEHVFSDPRWTGLVKPTFSSDHFLEISAAGVSKASTLEYVCNELGVRRKEVIAFGDMPNDTEMIKFAGIGVAMGNAHEDLKRIADMVTLPNVDDGVAVVLEKMLVKQHFCPVACSSSIDSSITTSATLTKSSNRFSSFSSRRMTFI